MRAINVLLAILVSLIIGAVVLEGGLRLIGFGPAVTLNQYDSVTGWSKKPNFSLSRKHPDSSQKLDFDLNSMGLRDDEFSTKKPEGVFRVIALGDSFTLGFGVNRENLFVDVLEHWWNEEGRRVEVINAGTEAYSTDQAVAWLDANGTALEPDLVLLFPYENDLYWNGQTAYGKFDKPRYGTDGSPEARDLVDPGPKPLVDRLALTAKLFGTKKKPDETFQPEGAENPILREFGALMTQRPDFMEEPLARTKGSLIALKKKCDALGCKVALAPIPSHSAVDAEYRLKFGSMVFAGLGAEAWSPDLPVDTFLKFAGEVGIPAIDCRTSFRSQTDADQALYHTKDWHLNADGNHAFARVLHDDLDRLGVFPADRLAPAEATAKPERATLAASSGPGLLGIFGVLWVVLTIMYTITYKDEPKWQPPLKVGALLTAVFCILTGMGKVLEVVPPVVGQIFLGAAVVVILGFVAYKLGRRLGTIAELFKAFTLRGHWYLMPLVVILLTIGSLLVVAASSPLVAPFIYTLF